VIATACGSRFPNAGLRPGVTIRSYPTPNGFDNLHSTMSQQATLP
jgi:hypothetical protein